jgi:membrane protein implicated in regulation of membrane protease activity
MLQEFLSGGALTLFYLAAVVISFVYAMLALVGAGVGDALDLDLDADVDADGELGFLTISPLALAMFGAAFGLTGLITRNAFNMSAAASLLTAAVIGIIIGVLAQLLFLYVLSPSKSSHYSLADVATGRKAEVIITIPADGLGTVALDTQSGRITLAARSAAGKQIAKGQVVAIESISGRMAVVRVDDAHEWPQLKDPSVLK